MDHRHLFRLILVTFVGTGLLVSIAVERGYAQPTSGLALELEHSHLWYTYPGSGGTRYFATRLVFRNSDNSPRTIKLSDFVLSVDGREFRPVQETKSLEGFAFEVDGETFRFRRINLDLQLTVPPAGDAATWAVFTGLPQDVDAPQITLHWSQEGKGHSLNITELHSRRLGLKIERLGPDNMLGLLTIEGTLDTVNAGVLTSAVEDLADDGLVRLVIAFTESAGPLSGDLSGWLIQTAQGQQTGGTYAQLPSFPGTFREVHLAALPTRSDDEPQESSHVHDTTVEAVVAALRSAFEVLPRAVVIEQLHRGHPLVRVAAMRGGGDRLPLDELSFVLSLLSHEDRLMQTAAVTALRHFPDRRAIEALTRLVRGDDEKLAELALECLAASRFGDAQSAFEKLLSEGSPGASPEVIIRLVSRYPSPFAADFLAGMLREGSRTLEPSVRTQALTTLAHLGHRDLVELCRQALASSDVGLQRTAFNLLASRPEPEAERLALEYTLESISIAPPTPMMATLLDRARDPRAVPLLVRHLDRSDLDRTSIITQLARIGGPEIPDVLANHFEGFTEAEQVAVFNCLSQLRSRRLRDLAPAVLDSKNGSLVQAAVNGLQADGGPEAVTILADALCTTPPPASASTLVLALREIASDEAQDVLRRLRSSSDPKLAKMAGDALRVIHANSPAKKHVDLGIQLVLREEWKSAITEFDYAIELDDGFSEAYSGRASAHLQLDELEAAAADYQRAYELDPEDDVAVTGLAIAQTRMGDVARGIATVESAVEQFNEENRFAYNRACVYGRAVEQLKGRPPGPDRDTELREYQAVALSALQQAIELGFDELDWMREDPDLAPLHELPEFQAIADPKTAEPDSDGQQPKGDAGRGTHPVPREE